MFFLFFRVRLRVTINVRIRVLAKKKGSGARHTDTCCLVMKNEPRPGSRERRLSSRLFARKGGATRPEVRRVELT